MIHGLVGAIRLAEAAAEGGAAEAGLSFNIFWILVSAANFGFFILVIRAVALGPITKMLDERRERIERGLRDAADAALAKSRAESDAATGQLLCVNFNFPIAIFATVIIGLTEGFSFRASALASTSKGIPLSAKARESAATLAPGDLTITAICDQGMPPFKCAARN